MISIALPYGKRQKTKGFYAGKNLLTYIVTIEGTSMNTKHKTLTFLSQHYSETEKQKSRFLPQDFRLEVDYLPKSFPSSKFKCTKCRRFLYDSDI